MKTKTKLWSTTVCGIRPRALIAWSCFGSYVTALGILGYQNSAGPEYRWWSTVNLDLPQLAWGVPAVLLFGFALVFLRKPWWLPFVFLSPLLYVAGPLMGWCGAGFFQRGAGEADKKNTLRVMTYNIGGSASSRDENDAANIVKNIAEAQPDVLLVQEDYQGSLGTTLRTAHPEWHVQTSGELSIVTSLPIKSFEAHVLSDFSSEPWKTVSYIRCVVLVGTIPVSVYNFHLMTPRDALIALRHHAPKAITQIEQNSQVRLSQIARATQAIAGETNPTIVAGDFNAPEISLVCRQIQNKGFRDAFAAGGSGYGYTFGHELPPHQSFVRIDHIFASAKDWQIQSCSVGAKEGSQHRPVIADFFLREAP